MLKADDNEKTNSIEEFPKSQLHSYSETTIYPSAQNEETITYQQQHPSPPIPTPIKTQFNKKNPFQMHTKLKIIPNEKKEDLNLQYLTTLNGVLKLVEVLLGFIAFILSLCADRRSTTSAWTEHITFETSLVVSVFIIGYVVFPHITISNEKTRKGLMIVFQNSKLKNFQLIYCIFQHKELLFYGSNSICYFISVWLMVHLSASINVEGRGAAIMTALFCVALCILYSFETTTKFKEWSGNTVTIINKKNETHQNDDFQKNRTNDLPKEHTNV